MIPRTGRCRHSGSQGRPGDADRHLYRSMSEVLSAGETVRTKEGRVHGLVGEIAAKNRTSHPQADTRASAKES